MTAFKDETPYLGSERFTDDPGFRTIGYKPLTASETTALDEDRLRYAAACYLDEWVATDLPCHETLQESGVQPDATTGTAQLAKFATSYGVIRTLTLKADESPRLANAYQTLMKAQRPANIEDAIVAVNALAERLKQLYGKGKTPLSASSKFLWVRFRSPVIIYDSIVRRWLGATEDYGLYCKAWLSEYQKHEKKIKEACLELKTIKRFTLASGIDDAELSTLLESRWFSERVFDHFIQNEMPWAQIMRDHLKRT